MEYWKNNIREIIIYNLKIIIDLYFILHKKKLQIDQRPKYKMQNFNIKKYIGEFFMTLDINLKEKDQLFW